jgi:hypothetical protein
LYILKDDKKKNSPLDIIKKKHNKRWEKNHRILALDYLTPGVL